MRKSLVCFAAGVILAAPITGYVQQSPGEIHQTPPSGNDLENLVSLHTKAIDALQKRIVELEGRVKKLEETPARGSNR